LRTVAWFIGAATLALCQTTIALCAQQLDAIRVLGQPLAAGPIQKNIEQPFMSTLASRFGLPLTIEYVPADSSPPASSEPLSALRSDQFQIAALRVSQVGRQEPAFLGLDLVGLNPDYATATRVIDTYTPVLDQWLQERSGVKLLAAWPFGPEVLFCSKPISQLSDIKGLRVRVFDAASAAMVEAAAGVPVTIGFGLTRQALAEGNVTCAIGNPSAALQMGWPEVTTHVTGAAIQLGINAYGMSLSAWRKLKPEHQALLSSAFQSLAKEIWLYSKRLSDDAINCSTGKEPCSSKQKLSLTYVPLSEPDVALLKDVLRKVSFPHWAETCDKIQPTCSEKWKSTVGQSVGLQ
jgi:TRAP-type C4-dicarboxylate transport system substrate-binding protein